VTEEISGYALSVLQDHVDPELLFLGTEFGLYVSSNGGESWTKFTAGVPTVSVMDMAIQQRENDLVLGTHGRSLFVLDDYSALRGLDSESFKERLGILSATPGQQYVANATPSTRFTGSGEFRAPNEDYGVVLTFVASGQDLPHPNDEKEKARKQAIPGKEKPGNDSDLPKITVQVSDSTGAVIRQFKRPVKQGINRLNWDLKHDGVRPMPGPKPPEADADLPGGVEVPPGSYRISLVLGEANERNETSVEVTVLADPRSDISQADRVSNYQSLLALQALQETSVTAVEKIVSVRNDVNALNALIQQQAGVGTADKLSQQATEVLDQLNALEQKFRVPPETRGNVYDEDRVTNKIATAQYYIGSSLDAATPASAGYVKIAENSLDAALAELNDFLGGPLQQFRESVDQAGIGLLSDTAGIGRSR
jgi:hypothetical protein